MKNKKILLLLFAIITLHVSIFAEKECPFCKKSVSNLTIHMKTHAREKPFACEKCNKKFTTKGYLTRHMQTHKGEKTYVCYECNDAFTTNDNLVRHMYIHAEERAYVCQECSKKFKTNSTLKIHMRTHTKERPYACHLCEKRFRQSAHLTAHMRTHTKEKPLHNSIVIEDKEEVGKNNIRKENDFLLNTELNTGDLFYLPPLCNLKETPSDESEKIWESLKKYMIHEPQN